VPWAADGVISIGSVTTPSSEARTAADKQFLITFMFIVVLSFKRDQICTMPKVNSGVTSRLYTSRCRACGVAACVAREGKAARERIGSLPEAPLVKVL
jgi:hypothetical protein